MRSWLSFTSSLAVLGVLAGSAHAAPCPNLIIKVDNDMPGSGYSEEQPENWQSNNVGACSGTYRYLSKYVGNGSSKGKAIWKPKITVNGLYQVKAGYRATVNRTTDADYYLHDDLGGVVHKVVNQAHPGDCTYENLGAIHCVVGGNCRVVLDGTDDNKSDCADLTTFELVSCDEPGDGGAPPGRCDGIRDKAAYEVCEETPTTCAGVFTDGSGCVAYCAAAGMTCVARFGGEPGCAKEANLPIPCDAMNGHASDYCECEGPPLDPPDAGEPADAGTGGAGGTTGAGAGGAGTAGAGGQGGGGQGGATSAGSGAGGHAGGGGHGGVGGQGGQGGAAGSGPGSKGGCSCELGGASPAPSGGLLAVLSLGWFARRRSSGRSHATRALSDRARSSSRGASRRSP